ncbi:MAG: hypothetical protein IKA74_04970 [Clostridia bacterium]|nr:hypothetical protein [Clostridia bacterium]
MKAMKRLLTLCTVAMLLATMLILTSCGGSDVEKAINKLAEAESYTYESDNYVRKVDVKNRVAYEKYTPDEEDILSKEKETWVWADAESGKFYSAEKKENTITKVELTKVEFIQEFGEYADTYDFMVYTKLFDLFDEKDGVYSFTDNSDEDRTVTSTLSVDENGTLISSYSIVVKVGDETKTTTYETKYSAINETEVSVAADVLSAEVKAAE